MILSEIKPGNRLFLILAILLPTLLIGAVKVIYTPAGQESSEDAFWHAAAGRRPLTEMLSKQFPLTLSVWRDHFADKELLYHLILKGYSEIKSLFHSELAPPFHGATIFFLLLFFTAFVTAAHSLGIPPPRILYASLLCAIFLPNFTYRLMMMRPHVFSMALMLFAVALLAQGPHKRGIAWGMFGLSFLYAWSYSSPHLILIPAFLFGFAFFREVRWKAFASLGASAGGLFCGLLIHPQSPNTFFIWKIQALDALLAPIAGKAINLPFARELLPPRFAWILLALPALICAYFCLMMLIRAMERDGWKMIPPNTRAITLLTVFWILTMCFISIRPVEYAIPTLCLCGMLWIEYARKTDLFLFFQKPWKLLLFLSVLLIACGSFTLKKCASNLEDWCTPAPLKLVEKLRATVPPGTRVVNIIWSDFPYLTFAAPEYEYTWALDPMFGYAYDPAKVTAIGSIGTNLRRRVSNTELGSITGADYAVVLFENNYCGRYLERFCGWRPVYKGPDGWIFRLKNE